MRAAGVRRFGGPVEVLELPGPRALQPDEVLISVRACGVGNWDEFARTGTGILGARPPMALGVEAAGLVAAVGHRVVRVTTGDRVTAHSVPLREQGTWAEQHVAAAGHVAVLPPAVSFDAAAALAVPALTADQAIGDELEVRAGQTVLVNGAGGVTGGMSFLYGFKGAPSARQRRVSARARIGSRRREARSGRPSGEPSLIVATVWYDAEPHRAEGFPPVRCG